MSQYKPKVINRRNSSKDFENCRIDHPNMESNFSIDNNQVCENCMNENNSKKEVCTYCSSLQKLKETHLFHKNESSKRDYDTNKLSKLNVKEIDFKASHNSSLRGFSMDSISLESSESAEKAAMKLYCKDCVELSRFRIIQNKLVFITDLAPEIASEKVLQKPEYLGQYGKIAKILVNNNSGVFSTACVVYSKEDEALAAILALDQFNLSDKTIRACSGNLLCRLNANNDLPFICAGGCVDLSQLEKDSEKLNKDDYSSKSVQQNIHTPKLQHLLSVLAKQQNEQRIEESVFPSTACIIQKIKKILSEMRAEEQSSLNLRAEEGETHSTKADSKPVRKGLKLPDRKSENQFNHLPTLEKFAALTKERELACTETMTVVSTTETCETNRSKTTENDIDTTINTTINDEDELRKESDSESPLSTMKFSHSEFKIQPEDLTIKRLISGNDSARNSLASSQRFDVLTSPSKSLEEDNESLVDTDKKISEGYFDKSRQRNASRFPFAQLSNVKEESEFDEIALTIKKHTTPIELKLEEPETVSYFDFGEKPENSIKISENESNVMQIETFLDKLNKSSASKLKHFNPNANNFVPTAKKTTTTTQAKNPEPKKEQAKLIPSSESTKKKAGLLSSSPALSTSSHLKSGRPNKINNNNYYETIENNYFPYYYPSVYETDIIAEVPSYIQDWGYGTPLGTIAVSYQDLYFVPYY